MKGKLKHKLTLIAAAMALTAAMSSCDLWNASVGMDIGTGGPVSADFGVSVPIGGWGYNPYYYPRVTRPRPIRPMLPVGPPRPMRPMPIGPFFP